LPFSARSQRKSIWFAWRGRVSRTHVDDRTFAAWLLCLVYGCNYDPATPPATRSSSCSCGAVGL
jgi:hypothetical protein